MTEVRDALSLALRGRLGDLDVDLSLACSGSPIVLIGPNGSGKTTLLRALAGARQPFAGRISVLGRTLFDSESQVNVAPEERRVGYVPQGYGLFPHLTALDNVGFGFGFRGRGREKAELCLAALDRFQAVHLGERYPSELSGGEAQRVALARAVVTAPEALLLDEPLAALDPTARRELRALLAEHVVKEAKLTVVVSHDARDVRALGGTVAVLERGRVVQQGSVEELARAPGSEFVAEFFEALR